MVWAPWQMGLLILSYNEGIVSSWCWPRWALNTRLLSSSKCVISSQFSPNQCLVHLDVGLGSSRCYTWCRRTLPIPLQHLGYSARWALSVPPNRQRRAAWRCLSASCWRSVLYFTWMYPQRRVNGGGGGGRFVSSRSCLAQELWSSRPLLLMLLPAVWSHLPRRLFTTYTRVKE